MFLQVRPPSPYMHGTVSRETVVKMCSHYASSDGEERTQFKRSASLPSKHCLVLPGPREHRSVRADDLRDFIEVRMTQQHLPGLSMAVIKNGKIVDARGFGLCEPGNINPDVAGERVRVGFPK
jgi:hypothetical protein